MLTDDYRCQHVAILGLCDRMRAMLSPEVLTLDASEVRGVLEELAVAITAHLRVEDGHLYPLLADSHDPLVRETARTFQAQMGDIADVFVAYVERWGGPSAIEGDAAGFVDETFQVYAALVQRIGLEEAELYPLADSASLRVT